MSTDSVDHAAARRAVFFAKENNARADRVAKLTPELHALRAAFRAAKAAWDPGRNNGKGGWKDGASTPPSPPKFESQTPPNPLGMDRTIADGKIITLADADDDAGLELGRAVPVAEAEEIAAFTNDLFGDRTGEILPEDEFQELRRRTAELVRQSHEIARKLEKAGVNGYSGGEYSQFLFDPVKFTVSPDLLHFSDAIEQARFRCCNFIPVIAQQKRRFIVKLLEYWLARNPYARFWTFTGGERCTVEHLRRRIQELHRTISRLNAEPFMKAAGVEIVFRATEIGSLTDIEGHEVRTVDGKWLFHPHAHCLVQLSKGRITPTAWNTLLKRVWEFMGSQWDDGGQITTVRECAKYPMKPTDVVRLDPEELKGLHEALQGLHLVQPLGVVKALKDSILEARQTLAYVRNVEGRLRLSRVKNWNRHIKREPLQGEPEPFHTKSALLGGDEIDPGASLENVLEGGSGEGTVRDGGPKAIATLAPGPYFDRVTRPGVLVIAKRFGPEEMRAVCAMPHVAAMIRASTPSYLAAVALLRTDATKQPKPSQSLLGFTHMP